MFGSCQDLGGKAWVLRWRRKTAEAAGKAHAVLSSLFFDMSDLEIGADLLCMATLCWAGVVWMVRWDEDLENCRRRQVWEITNWNEVRGPAGAMVRNQ